MSVNY